MVCDYGIKSRILCFQDDHVAIPVKALNCGFVINKGGATATDILELIHLVQDVVFDKFGVRLEPEVRIIESK